MKKSLIILLAIAVFFIFGPRGCATNRKPKRHVVLFVIDSFSESEESHGNLVAQMANRACYGKCEIKAREVFHGKGNDYIRILREILEYAKEHPDEGVVVNISLSSKNFSLKEQLLVSALHERKVVIVAAAGNDDSYLPRYPAFYKETIAVAAVSGKYKASYSNYGRHIDLSSEGFESAQVVKYEIKHTSIGVEETIYYNIRGGTSFAAPRVSGLIAYLLRQRPELTPDEIKHLVKENTMPLKSKYFQNGLLGAGKIAPYRTLRMADPLYQRILTFQILALIEIPLLMLMLLLPIWRKVEFFGSVFFFFLFFMTLAIVLDLFLVGDSGLIKHGIVGGIIAVLLNIIPLVAFLWYRLKRKEEVWIQVHSRQCRDYFAGLVKEGYKISDALFEVSKASHPELSLQTHRKIASRFTDIGQLLLFLNLSREKAAAENTLVDEKVLKLLEETMFGGGHMLYTR